MCTPRILVILSCSACFYFFFTERGCIVSMDQHDSLRIRLHCQDTSNIGLQQQRPSLFQLCMFVKFGLTLIWWNRYADKPVKKADKYRGSPANTIYLSCLILPTLTTNSKSATIPTPSKPLDPTSSEPKKQISLAAYSRCHNSMAKGPAGTTCYSSQHSHRVHVVIVSDRSVGSSSCLVCLYLSNSYTICEET